jgi:predicted AlkP superfamily pyrophosphatase or phosphodiesterase
MENLDPSFFDTKTNLVNLSNSVLAHYGVPTFHPSLPEVDELLKGHQKVVIFLFDGMGKAVLSRWPHQSKYIREHGVMTIHSVNPATTVACTTGLLTGRYPIETGWLGWSLYFEDKGFPIDVFPNKNSLTDESMGSVNVMAEECPVEHIDQILCEHGVKATCVMKAPLGDGQGPKTMEEIPAKVEAAFEAGNNFVYCYWTEPDELLHEFGTESHKIRHNIRKINALVKKFVKDNPDILVLTIADHGLIDVQYRDIAAFPEIASTLRLPLSLEGRTPTFFIKEGMEQQFVTAFKKHFPDFYLMTKDEVLSSHYFGEGTPSEKALSFLGDYTAVALGRGVLVNTLDKKNINVHLGHHAGGSPAEREILLSAYNR